MNENSFETTSENDEEVCFYTSLLIDFINDDTHFTSTQIFQRVFMGMVENLKPTNYGKISATELYGDIIDGIVDAPTLKALQDYYFQKQNNKSVCLNKRWLHLMPR